MLNVVSLFDGLGGARIALDNLGVPCNYFASEIDQHAIKVHQSHFPSTFQIGSVTSLNGSFFQNPVDLLIGGSPCQDLSRGGNMIGLGGTRSSLFFEYVRLLKEIKPKYFLLENVKSMKKQTLDEINKYMGCEPLIINSSDFTAQNRTRCYWTNIDVDFWYDKKILLKDIWDYNTPWESHAAYTQVNKRSGGGKHGMYRTGYMPCSLHAGPPLPRELVFSIEGKARAVSTTFSQFPWYSEKLFSGNIRRTTALECERLQGLPDNYTLVPGISTGQRYKMIGNGFTIPVIEHILKGMK